MVGQRLGPALVGRGRGPDPDMALELPLGLDVGPRAGRPLAAFGLAPAGLPFRPIIAPALLDWTSTATAGRTANAGRRRLVNGHRRRRRSRRCRSRTRSDDVSSLGYRLERPRRLASSHRCGRTLSRLDVILAHEKISIFTRVFNVLCRHFGSRSHHTLRRVLLNAQLIVYL